MQDNNSPIIPATVPPAPEVQRAVQALMDMTHQGRISGVAFVALTSDGELVTGQALPQAASTLYLAIGALQGLVADLVAYVSQLRRSQQTSRILKPQMMHHGSN